MSRAKDPDKPSASTRFRKGQSGNPRGRPKKRAEPQVSAFDVVIDKTLTIVQAGVPRAVTVDEALQHQIYRDAIAGNGSARREVLKMIAKREKAITEKHPAPSRTERRIEKEDPRNADEALLILEIAHPDPRSTELAALGQRERLLLERWAVEAALGRRAGSKLSRNELSEARRCTHDGETIRWPDAAEP